MSIRIVVLIVGAAVASGAACREPAAGTWPTQPVRLIVPFGAGTSGDLLARLFAPLLAERWQQPVVVDNRAGGDGVVGVQAFVGARDGHTLLVAPMGVVTTNPLLHDDLPFDPIHDVVPIAAAAQPGIAIAAASGTGVRTLGELVALVRERPGQYVWAATPGLPELVMRAFLKLEGLSMNHAPYRDIAPAVHDLRGGRVQLMFAALPTLAPAVESSHARLLAVTTSTRAPSAPEIPTTAEAGYPALTVEGPFGFFGWRGMTDDLRDRIAGDVQRAAEDPALVARLTAVRFVVRPGTSAEFARAVEAQRAQVLSLARIAGLLPADQRGQ